MRFLHTADWHLGRLFHGRSLIDDQAHVLEEFVALVRETRPDAVLIAGDVYDRAVPPPEAVALLDETLSRVVVGEKVPTVLIAGNHDSPDRLGFGARLLAAGGLTVCGRPGPVVPVHFEDEHGRVTIYPVPYAEPAVVRDVLEQPVSGHDQAMAALLARLRPRATSDRSVLMAHAFVAGGEASDSERPLSVGGSECIDLAHLRDFDYVALGHLHRPQSMGGPRVQYAGSLLKYSLSEAGHRKSVSLVELGRPGAVPAVERIALSPKRDLIIIEGALQELIGAAQQQGGSDDYVFARLTDLGALLDPMSRLREVYPNAVGCERLALTRVRAQQVAAESAGAAARQLDTPTLFENFFREVTGDELDAQGKSAIVDALEQLALSNRESS